MNIELYTKLNQDLEEAVRSNNIQKMEEIKKRLNNLSENKELTGYPHIDKPWRKYYDKKFLSQELPHQNIYDYMKEKTLLNQEMIAMNYFGNNITYNQLYDNIDDASRILSQVGVQDNDRVMNLMPNIPETAYLLYGTSQLGGVSDYVDPRPDSVDLNVSAKKILSLIEEEKAKYIVALDQCYLGMIRPIEHELKELGINNIIIVSASDSMNLKSTINYLIETANFNGVKTLKMKLKQTKKLQELMQLAEKNSSIELLKYSDLLRDCKNSTFTPVDYKESKLDVIVHTSGTSSPKPKPIPLTNDNLNAYVHQTFGANMSMTPGAKALHILPYFAAFGIVDVVHAGLCHSNNLIQVPEFSPAHLGKLIMKYKPQTIIGTPTWFLSMINDPILRNADLSFLRMVTYGGDSMEIDDEIKINKFLTDHNSSCILTKGHGMSETCGCASYAIGDYNKLGSVGIPMPNTTYALVDPETKELIKFKDDEDSIEGELIISSKDITSGILDGKVIVPHATYDGEDFIYTKDIAKMDRNGIITFLSRSDRTFTRYDGFKVKTYEIENVIKEDSQIKYCIVSPYYAEEKFGNMPIADIVLKDNIQLTDSEKVDYIENLIHNNFTNNPLVSTRQIPSKFRFRNSIPITSNGKVDYNALANEKLTGNEISVEIEETNISVGNIKVLGPNKNQKVLFKKINE